MLEKIDDKQMRHSLSILISDKDSQLGDSLMLFKKVSYTRGLRIVEKQLLVESM